MARLDNSEIKQELGFVYITKDGKRFADIDEACEHQKTIDEDAWLTKIKVSKNKFTLKK